MLFRSLVATNNSNTVVGAVSPTNNEAFINWVTANSSTNTGLPYSHVNDTNLLNYTFTYDAAQVALSYLAQNSTTNAQRIIDYYISTTNVWRLGGANSAVDSSSTNGAVKEYKVHAGPNAFLGIAAVQAYNINAEPRNLELATRIADFLISLQNNNTNDVNYGGLRWGPQGDAANPTDQRIGDKGPQFNTFYCTENNIDAYALFNMLYRVTGEAKYREAADINLRWLKNVAYNRPEHRFNWGYKEQPYKLYENELPGIETATAPDAIFWGISAIGPKALEDFEPGCAEKMMQYAESNFVATITFTKPNAEQVTVTGFDYTDHASVKKLNRAPMVSAEWTFDAINAYRRLADHFAQS